MDIKTTPENIYGNNAIVGGSTTATQPTEEQKETNVNLTITQEQGGQPPATQQAVSPAVNSLVQDVQKQLTAEKDLQEQLAAKDIDFNALSAEYGNLGKLSDKTMASLEKAGYPKTAVDAYLAGIDALAARFTDQVISYAGSQEDFKNIQSFVQSLGDSYVNAFNASISSGDLNQIKMNIEGFKAQMLQKFGTSNPMLMGKGSDTSSTGAFSSTQDMISAINDPKYGRDNSYTAEVQKKIINSSFIS